MLLLPWPDLYSILALKAGAKGGFVQNAMRGVAQTTDVEPFPALQTL